MGYFQTPIYRISADGTREVVRTVNEWCSKCFFEMQRGIEPGTTHPCAAPFRQRIDGRPEL
jgi:hypothetical protein